MRHDIHLKGPAFQLRPVELADSAFILALRTDPQLSRYINPTSDRIEDQEAWVRRYFDRAGDYYWIIVRTQTGQPEGAVAVYDVDAVRGEAEWGRWVIKRGSLAAVESALLVYRAGFELLRLGRVYCRTVCANRSVVSFHDSCRLETRADARLKVRLLGRDHDVVEQFLVRERWPAVERALEDRAFMVARLLAR